jgi:hypothetical protein
VLALNSKGVAHIHGHCFQLGLTALLHPAGQHVQQQKAAQPRSTDGQLVGGQLTAATVLVDCVEFR